MANAKSLSLTVPSQESETFNASRRVALSARYSKIALKSFLFVPLFPLLGHYLIDQTGISQWLIATGIVPAQILGEGFGHVGLCFSIHYLFTGLKAVWKMLALFWVR